MIGRPTFYCSDLSRGVAEQAFGTASTGNIWLLVEYPFGWERRAVEESALSQHLKAFLAHTVKTIPGARVLLIKAEHPHPIKPAFFVVRSSERAPFIAKFLLSSYEELPELDIAEIAMGNVPTNGEIFTEPLFLVCTHGRRDKCCAKFGYPLYKSLRRLSGGNVWQSSHVGGDRFAANLVCLPHGLFYAHVTVEAGQEIISEYREGRMVLDKYRGRACYSHAAQSAEFFVRNKTAILGVDDLRHVSTHRLAKDCWRVRFTNEVANTIYEANVYCRMSDFQNFITCDSDEEKRISQFALGEIQVGAACE